MKLVIGWITKYRGALYVSGTYGVAALLLFMIGMLSGRDGPQGAWLLIFYSAWPISHLFIIVVSLLEDFLSDGLFRLLCSVTPILAGMLWFYLIARCFLVIRAKPKGK